MRLFIRLVLICLLAAWVVPAWGSPAKLDARARAALARARAGEPAARLRAQGVAVDREGRLNVFIHGAASRAELEGAGAIVRTALPGLCTASIPIAAVERVAALAGVTAIRGGAPCQPELDVSVPQTGAPAQRGTGPTFDGTAGQGVVVGFVDSGIDYDNGDFDDPAGNTRIIALWDQTELVGPGPPAFPYGRECSPAQINAGTCPERDSLQHGTHVAGIAAGDGSNGGGARPPYTFVGMAPRADLVVVKTDFQTPEVVDGVAYVFNTAASLGKNAVVNLSIGTQFGSHDGTSVFEQAIAELTGPGRIIVKSAGNDRGSTRHGEVFATAPGASATVVVSGSAVDRYFYIDGYYNATERLRVQIKTPINTIIGPLTLNTANADYPGVSTNNGLVYVTHDSLSSGQKNVYVEVTCEQSGKPINGTWTITMLADQLGPANGQTDFWMFEAASGLTAGFATGNVPTRELITEPGNAANVVTVGAWVSKTSWTGCNGTTNGFGMPAAGNLAPFSSPGPTRDGRAKPDLTAPGSAIVSTTSWDIPHVCPGGATPTEYINDGLRHRAMQGTSVAAPHAVGAVAMLLQRQGALTPSQVVSYLRSHALVDGFTGAVPSNDWGYGKLQVGDLVPPVVTLVSPNGGEHVNPGEELPITWTASDAGGSVPAVDLLISRTGLGGPYETIASAIPNTGSYSWLVSGSSTVEGNAYLKVVARDANGNPASDLSDAGFTVVGQVAVDGPSIPAFGLGAVRPNPTSAGATIEYSLAREAHVSLRIHDLLGRTVAVLADGVRPAGLHRVRWEGTRDATRAPAGLYFLDFRTPDGRFEKRLVVTH